MSIEATASAGFAVQVTCGRHPELGDIKKLLANHI
jgi:hypothetical protein